MKLIDAHANCTVCGKEWYSKNAMAVAARHHKATGHEVLVELTYGHIFKKSG